MILIKFSESLNSVVELKRDNTWRMNSEELKIH